MINLSDKHIHDGVMALDIVKLQYFIFLPNVYLYGLFFNHRIFFYFNLFI